MYDDLLEELYRKYYNRAFFYVLSLCGNRGDAEEIVQDAFAEACLSLPDDVPSFLCWLMRVCRNRVIDRWRHEKFLSGEEPKDRAGGESPAEALLGNESTAALYRALRKLPAGGKRTAGFLLFCAAPYRRDRRNPGHIPGGGPPAADAVQSAFEEDHGGEWI